MWLYLLIVAVTIVIFYVSAFYELLRFDIQIKYSKIFMISAIAVVLELCVLLIMVGIRVYINL